MPQIHILLILWVLNDKITLRPDPGLFIATFTTSVLSAALGIAKFLKIGPCRLVPEEGPLGGHGSMAFLVLMINIFSTIMAKGFLLPALGYGIEFKGHGLVEPLTKNLSSLVGIWFAACYLPQLIYVGIALMSINTLYINHLLLFQSTIILFSSIGLENSLKIIFQYPALILTPVFSCWTFGDPKACCKRNHGNKIKVSFTLSWGNMIITTVAHLALFLVHFFMKDFSDNLLPHLISSSFLLLSWITLKILQDLQKFQRFCCSYCQSDQVFQKTILDPNSPDELIDPSNHTWAST